jgi:DNA primase
VNYEIVHILDTELGGSKKFGGGEHYYFCPFCNHYNPKLAVNINKGKWQCWTCNARGGSLMSLLRKMKVPREQIRKLSVLLETYLPKEDDPTDVVDVTLPSEFLPLWEPSSLIGYRRASAYAKGRGITFADVLRYRIGYCVEGRYANRLIVPSYDAQGSLNFFVARDFTGSAFVNYVNPPVSKDVVAFDYYTNWEYPIVLVEGMFDAMAVKRNAIPLLGKTLPRRLQKKIIETGTQDVYLALDNDALKDTIRIAETLTNEGVTVWLIELDGKDPSDLGGDAMSKLMKQARRVDFLTLMQLKLRLC